MPGGVSREQIDRAKQVKILDYILTHESGNVRQVGSAHYLKDHDSLEVSNGLWNWHSQGVGGRNVVDYLIKVRGFGFVDAVRHLTGDISPYKCAAPRAAQAKVRIPFKLPKHNADNERVITYLQSGKLCLMISILLDLLRHTFASLQIASGVDLRTLQSRTGHAKATTLLNTYSHVIKSAQERAAKAVEDALLAGFAEAQKKAK